ncbi:MAG: histidine phosphatase family protein, partial [Chloroflexota bacterium]
MAIVRHGQSEGNVKKVWHGARSDEPLTEHGKKQAQVTAKYLAATMKNVKKIYCSPMKRAHQTANVIAEEIGVDVEIMLGLIEIDWGDLEGLTTEQ